MIFFVLLCTIFSIKGRSRSWVHSRKAKRYDSQLSCVKDCMEDITTGKITVTKRTLCGKKCALELNLEQDEEDNLWV